jgi:hypothetical protein
MRLFVVLCSLMATIHAQSMPGVVVIETFEQDDNLANLDLRTALVFPQPGSTLERSWTHSNDGSPLATHIQLFLRRSFSLMHLQMEKRGSLSSLFECWDPEADCIHADRPSPCQDPQFYPTGSVSESIRFTLCCSGGVRPDGAYCLCQNFTNSIDIYTFVRAKIIDEVSGFLAFTDPVSGDTLANTTIFVNSHQPGHTLWSSPPINVEQAQNVTAIAKVQASTFAPSRKALAALDPSFHCFVFFFKLFSHKLFSPPRFCD